MGGPEFGGWKYFAELNRQFTHWIWATRIVTPMGCLPTCIKCLELHKEMADIQRISNRARACPRTILYFAWYCSSTAGILRYLCDICSARIMTRSIKWSTRQTTRGRHSNAWRSSPFLPRNRSRYILSELLHFLATSDTRNVRRQIPHLCNGICYSKSAEKDDSSQKSIFIHWTQCLLLPQRCISKPIFL